jgi:urease accessory protein
MPTKKESETISKRLDNFSISTSALICRTIYRCNSVPWPGASRRQDYHNARPFRGRVAVFPTPTIRESANRNSGKALSKLGAVDSARFPYVMGMKTPRNTAFVRKAIFTTVSALAIFTPLLASAHPGLPGHSHGFVNGFAHPFSGLDHLLAMMAVGLWAAQQGGKAIWQVPLAFLSAMILGGIFGMMGLGECSMMDQAIAVTVLVMGIMVATATRMPLSSGMLLVSIFALFHGYAHGAEMPAASSSFLYAAGFIFATAILQVTGICLGLIARNRNSMNLVRSGGWVIAVSGIYLIATA